MRSALCQANVSQPFDGVENYRTHRKETTTPAIMDSEAFEEQQQEVIRVEDDDDTSIVSEVSPSQERSHDRFLDEYMYDREEIECMKDQLRPRQKQMNSSICCCLNARHESRSAKFRTNVRRTVHLLNISPRQKALILDRYVALVEEYANVKQKFTVLYNSTRCVTTLCGILTPALVSIQPFFGADSFVNPVYWATFSTSFTLALINGYISLYKIDKKYQSTIKAHSELESAGWEYFSLVGRYAQSADPDAKPTHSTCFLQFMDRVEEIRKGESKVDYGASSASEEHSGAFRASSIDIHGGASSAELKKKAPKIVVAAPPPSGATLQKEAEGKEDAAAA